VLLAVALLGAGGIVGVNAFVDPLWFFPHEHALNRVQVGFDERAQKTNWLRARPGRFDAVLFGSSRVTYVDQRDFAPWRLFNYSVNAMWPQEYRPYLDHFARLNGPPALVVLGVDFHSSRHLRPSGGPRDPAAYPERAGDPRYLVSSLLSFDLLRRSLRVAARSAGLLGPAERFDRYDRRNVRRMAEPIDDVHRAGEVLADLELFRTELYAGYRYNEDLPALWRGLRAAYPNTRFVVFTTPVAEPMFAQLVQEGRLEDYGRWLADLTAAFGEVWDFMGVNSVTTDLSRYRDAQHFDPGVGRLIADRLMGRPLPPRHADFGRRVTPATLAEHLALIRGQVPCLDPDPIRTAWARLTNGGVADAAGCPVGEEEPAAPSGWPPPAGEALERLPRDLKAGARPSPDG
jgi:hypothetical protein